MLQARSDGRTFLAVTVGLVALAWTSLILLGESPYGEYLHHESLAGLRQPISLAFLGRAGFFLVGWSLMIVAMMLPTTLPLVSLFRTMIRTHANRVQLVLLVFSGYVLAWSLFGIAAYCFDLGIHEAVAAVPWIDQRAWLITVAVLLAAGVYQFTPLKYYCLDKCRSPYAFILSHWHGNNSKAEAFRLGVSHGLFCVGCCWSIMLMLFAIGMGNLAWMALVAVAMGVEKNFPWGKQLTPALGAMLLSAGITLAAMGNPGAVCAC